MKVTKFLVAVALTASLSVSGALAAQGQSLENASAKVQKLIKKNDLKVVDFEYTKKAVNGGTKTTAKSILVDARPEAQYKKSTIPSSINIPDTKFKEFVVQLKDTAKDKELIVFCGGWKCGKSPKVAVMLKKEGFKNVVLYQAGEPEWAKKSYTEVSIAVAKSVQAKNSGLIVDARPYKKTLQETIPGAIAIPDTKIDSLIGRFPSNKDEKILVFCGGYSCTKSHKIANKLIETGYTNVSVYAGGLPEWKKAGLATTASGASKITTETSDTKPKFSKNGVMLGLDEGTVDGEWIKKLILENKVPANIQIVDVTSKEEFKSGHLVGSINITAGDLTAKELYEKLPKDKSVIFNCTAGGRSLEAWTKLQEAEYDLSEVFYFDANIDCKGNDCKIEVNEPLG